ncbi:conserved hypothetical protein [delta proteobacterium NaphS2]|nr:conserved hypothetical protein [delta proteobacterium NaphS2]
MNEKTEEKENSEAQEQAAQESKEGGSPEKAPKWESELDVYPLREPSDDPRWAVRTVWIWTGFAIAALIFIFTLLVLGAIYD